MSLDDIGVGSAQHIPMELLQAMTGMKLVHVVYKGITPAFNDLLAGQVPIRAGDTLAASVRSEAMAGRG